MIASKVHRTPGLILDKLDRLLAQLQVVKENYEQAALHIHSKALRLSLLTLSQESKQYANELMSHIESLGGVLSVTKKRDVNRMNDGQQHPILLTGKTEELREMNLGEQRLLQTYRDVLNEPFLYEALRQRLRYQQNGLMHCFSQMKLLYAAMIRHPEAIG